jgi:hypothetical protein
MPVVEVRSPVKSAVREGLHSGAGAVRVGEEDAAAGERVDVGSTYAGVAAQAAQPVVHVVDGDQQDVAWKRGGHLRRIGERRGRRRGEEGSARDHQTPVYANLLQWKSFDCPALSLAEPKFASSFARTVKHKGEST